MECGINIVTVDEEASEIIVIHSERFKTEQEVYDAYDHFEESEVDDGDYLVEFFVGDEVIAAMPTCQYGAIYILSELTMWRLAA